MRKAKAAAEPGAERSEAPNGQAKRGRQAAGGREYRRPLVVSWPILCRILADIVWPFGRANGLIALFYRRYCVPLVSFCSRLLEQSHTVFTLFRIGEGLVVYVFWTRSRQNREKTKNGLK